LAEEFRSAGAQVTGIDGSARLVQRARRTYPNTTFLVHDLTNGLPRPHRTYDRVVAHMVLMDLPELARLVADLRTSLTPDGVFVFSILHPCFFAHTPVEDVAAGERYRKIAGYLNHERRWITSFGGHHHYHRPLSWYVDLLTDNGLVVTGMHEPRTLPQHLKPETEWSDYERWFASIPTMLAISCKPANM
jgi:SAM-dependent methyltransferase